MNTLAPEEWGIPPLESRQVEIHLKLTGTPAPSEEERQRLQAHCAVLGHVKALIRTANYDTCFYCGIHMP